MKVLCINDLNWFSDVTNSYVHGPSYGEICKVTGLDKDGGYLLYGYQQYDGYYPPSFIPLSDIDETELIKERYETA